MLLQKGGKAEGIIIHENILFLNLLSTLFIEYEGGKGIHPMSTAPVTVVFDNI